MPLTEAGLWRLEEAEQTKWCSQDASDYTQFELRRRVPKRYN